MAHSQQAVSCLALAQNCDNVRGSCMMAHFPIGMHATYKGPNHQNSCSHISRHRHPSLHQTSGAWAVLATSVQVPRLTPNNPRLLGSAARSDWLHSPSSRVLQCRLGMPAAPSNPTMAGTSRPSAL